MDPAAKVALLAFFIILTVMRALTARNEEKSEEVVNRVKKFAGHNSQENIQDKDRKKYLLGLFSALFRIFIPHKLLDRIEADLVQADILLKPEEMIFINLAAAIVPASFALLILQNAALAVMLLPIGALVPQVFVKNAKTRRIRKFNDQLGDALMIMANSLRAGFSFLQTMDSLSNELPPPISTEFSRALKEMRLGTPTEEALRNMTERIESDDLELIVTAVNIQRQVGGNLAQILDSIATTINERVRIKGEIKTLTAQGRISGAIVALLPVFLMVVISLINPPYAGLLFSHPIGYLLLGGAIISEIIGIVLIRRIVNVEM
ncbi:MAG: type II secretion system F family protein [Bacillota bacterium]|nr:type II secretion system F family protein [Bacillota bacterium]MDW7683949.1 type II secretion system F family protein [Bacillota bacterium]